MAGAGKRENGGWRALVYGGRRGSRHQQVPSSGVAGGARLEKGIPVGGAAIVIKLSYGKMPGQDETLYTCGPWGDLPLTLTSVLWAGEEGLSTQIL